MAASSTVLRQKNGAGEVATALRWTDGFIRFKTTDAPSTCDDVGAIVEPGSVVRSYEAWLRLYMGLTPPSGTLTAPKFFTTIGAYPTGVSVYVRTTNPGAYATPVVPSDDSAGTLIKTYTSASPKALDAVNAGPFSTASADFGDYLVLWMTVTSSLTIPSDARDRLRLPAVPFSIRWNET